jgi:hypothetical protein
MNTSIEIEVEESEAWTGGWRSTCSGGHKKAGRLTADEIDTARRLRARAESVLSLSVCRGDGR